MNGMTFGAEFIETSVEAAPVMIGGIKSLMEIYGLSGGPCDGWAGIDTNPR